MVLRGERTGMEKRFFELCERVVPETGLELYDLDYLTGSSELRVFIRDPQTKTAVIEDCMKVDRALSPFLEEDWTPEALTLEVSSPGLFRHLKTLEHFKEVVGENITLSLSGKIVGEGLSKAALSLKKITAPLKAVDDKGLVVEIENKAIVIEFEKIKKANLETELAPRES
jgi:ribosome maturation factor RimP